MVKRRDFLKAAALAAGTNASPASGTEPDAGPGATVRKHGRHALKFLVPPGTSRAVNSPCWRFPWGELAPAASPGGRGQLRDWEIFNHPDKGLRRTCSPPSAPELVPPSLSHACWSRDSFRHTKPRAV